jgi:CRP/FNR family cyclic AMP-dependent transcriptional regulator
MSRQQPVDDQLAEVPLFQGLAKKQLRDVSELMTRTEEPEGSVLIEEGTRGKEFFVILEGHVEVRENGTVISTLGPGSFFGEMGLLQNRPHSATVVATSPVVVEVLDGDQFAELIHEYPEIGVQIMSTMANRLDQLEQLHKH